MPSLSWLHKAANIHFTGVTRSWRARGVYAYLLFAQRRRNIRSRGRCQVWI